jgi:UDP-N-acetylmuramate--alanine ligase
MTTLKQHILFIGIAGHAMRGIALAAKARGNIVTGLDEQASPGPGVDWLKEQGLEWTTKPDQSLLSGIDLIIVSGATPNDYPLLEQAKAQAIRVISFAEYLGDLTAGKHVIAVSGTHGKTTTTALITWLLESAGKTPDYLIGIRPFNFDSSARLADSATFVVEGDEYRASTLDTRSKVQYYHPDTLVLTSVEHDHPDSFPNLQSVIDRFKVIVANLPAAGRMVAWAESPTVMQVAAIAPCPVDTYGINTGKYRARNIAFLPTGIEFDVHEDEEYLGRIATPLYGRHNVLNGLAAVAVALSEGLSFEEIVAGAATFKGAFRRFNRLTAPDAQTAVIDDYAHHPTEVAATLEAAQLHYPGRRIIAVFRPHTYSRTAALLVQYQKAFTSADVVYITDIEGAREEGKAHTVSGKDIVDKLKAPAFYIDDRSKLISTIQQASKPGDVIVCMTVSGYIGLAEELSIAQR